MNPNSNLGFQHVLHKHEQELLQKQLQKQQMYQSNQYPQLIHQSQMLNQLSMHPVYYPVAMNMNPAASTSFGLGSTSGLSASNSGSSLNNFSLLQMNQNNNSRMFSQNPNQSINPNYNYHQYNNAVPSSLQQVSHIQQLHQVQTTHVPQAHPLTSTSASTLVSNSESTTSESSMQGPQHMYQCHLCEKQFRRKSWLKRHLLSHSNEKKFHCPWCSSTHKRKDNLLQHLKLKHTQILLQEFSTYGILLNVNNGSGNIANLVATSDTENAWVINNDPAITIRDLLDSNILPKDQVKRCLNYIVDNKCK